jgi:hypothetical protein
MEALPLELRQHISAYLLPHHDRCQLVALPTTTSVERDSVYNLRLTCRRTHEGAWQVFSRIVEDVPTECREESLRNLEFLVALPGVSSNVTCLALNAYKLYDTRKQWREDLEQETFHRQLWLKQMLARQLRAIVGRAGRLCHLICVLERLRPASFERSLRLERHLQSIPDPMHVSCSLDAVTSCLHFSYAWHGSQAVTATRSVYRGCGTAQYFWESMIDGQE